MFILFDSLNSLGKVDRMGIIICISQMRKPGPEKANDLPKVIQLSKANCG